MVERPPRTAKLRKDVQAYMRSCERLLAVNMSVSDRPLSADEIEVVKYYMNELRQLLQQEDQKPGPE